MRVMIAWLLHYIIPVINYSIQCMSARWESTFENIIDYTHKYTQSIGTIWTNPTSAWNCLIL